MGGTAPKTRVDPAPFGRQSRRNCGNLGMGGGAAYRLPALPRSPASGISTDPGTGWSASSRPQGERRTGDPDESARAHRVRRRAARMNPLLVYAELLFAADTQARGRPTWFRRSIWDTSRERLRASHIPVLQRKSLGLRSVHRLAQRWAITSAQTSEERRPRPVRHGRHRQIHRGSRRPGLASRPERAATLVFARGPDRRCRSCGAEFDPCGEVRLAGWQHHELVRIPARLCGRNPRRGGAHSQHSGRLVEVARCPEDVRVSGQAMGPGDGPRGHSAHPSSVCGARRRRTMESRGRRSGSGLRGGGPVPARNPPCAIRTNPGIRTHLSSFLGFSQDDADGLATSIDGASRTTGWRDADSLRSRVRTFGRDSGWGVRHRESGARPGRSQACMLRRTNRREPSRRVNSEGGQ